jgi:hypothetical protein
MLMARICPVLEIARSIRDPVGDPAKCLGADCQFWNTGYKDCQLKFGT